MAAFYERADPINLGGDRKGRIAAFKEIWVLKGLNHV